VNPHPVKPTALSHSPHSPVRPLSVATALGADVPRTVRLRLDTPGRLWLFVLAWLWCAIAFAQPVTNCCPPCPPPYPHSVTVTLAPGVNYLVNPLCHGTDNTSGTLLASVPDSSTLWLWDAASGTFLPPLSFFAGLGWEDSLGMPAGHTPLPPGDGFILHNPGPAYTLTFRGCDPVCPRPCGPDALRRLVGVVGPGAGTWTNLYSCPPGCGTLVQVWNPMLQQFEDHSFNGSAWVPSAPSWPAGTSVFVSTQPGTNCCATPPAGLVAWWPLDELTGAPLLADVQSGYHATVIPGPLGSSLAPTPLPGKVAGAVMFYATNGYGQVTSVPALNVATASFSVDAWVYPVSCGPFTLNPIVDKLVQWDPLSGYAFYLEGGQLRLALGDPLAGGQVFVTTLPVLPNAWNFLAVSVDYPVGTVTFHVNGASQTAAGPPPVPTLPNPAPLWIGGSRQFGPSPLPSPGFCESAVDELEIFNRALSAADFAPIFLADQRGKCKPALNCSNSVVRITCPPDTNIVACTSNVVVFYPAPATFTTCGTITNLTCVPPSGATFPAGVTTVTCTATDSQGNSATCTFTVTILPDHLQPDCPPTSLSITGCPPRMPNFATNGLVTDNCTPVGEISVIQNPPAGTALPPGATQATLVICDLAGNCRECVVTIQAVYSGTPPVITCPSNIVTTVYVGCGSGVSVTYPPPVIVNGALASCAPPSGSAFPLGVTTVTCVATNDCATNLCTFTVTVNYGGVTPQCVPHPSNMVMWLRFDETNGPTALNSSAGNHGTLANGPTRALGQYVQNSLTCNSANQYVQVNPYPAMQFGTGDFSVDAWVKTTSPGPAARFIVDHREQSGPVVRGYGVFLSTNNVLALQLADGTSANYYSVLPVPADGRWHHVAVTVKRGDPQGIRFYVNGTPDPNGYNPAAHPGSITAGPCFPFRVACQSASVTGLFPGGIDEVELFRRALAAGEVKALFDAQCRGKCRLTCQAGGFNETLECWVGNTLTHNLVIGTGVPYPQNVQWQLISLPAGPGCSKPGPIFNPSSGTATIPPYMGVVQLQVTIPADLGPGDCSCFLLIVTLPDGSQQVTCPGSYCRPPTGHGICSAPETPFGVATNLDAGHVAFTLTHSGPAPVMLSNCLAILRSPENAIVGITPLPPVEVPAAGTGSVAVPVTFAFPEYDPGRSYRLSLEADFEGNGTFAVVGSVPVMNALSAGESEGPLTVRRLPGGPIVIGWPNPCAILEVNPNVANPAGWMNAPVQTSPWIFLPEPGTPALFLRLRQ
jgi:hypothetical protein